MLAAALAGSAAQAATPSPAPVGLTADSVNDAALLSPVKAGDKGAATLRAQILLERARFSPGEIDAAYGSNMHQAIAGFQASRGLEVNGNVDAATWVALDSDSAPVLVAVTLTAEDVAGPFRPLPAGVPARAKLDTLGYVSPLESLGEKFHASPALLKQLNPGKDFGLAGEQLLVPGVEASLPMPAVAKLVVDKSDDTVSLLDAAGKVVAQYPASSGSAHDPLPLGDWKIKGVARHPTFHYNPKLFWDAKAADAKATLPAGPNNPVGVVWIDLSKEHYGIHGTPEPSKIGKTQSHGCIRMTNWSARAVSEVVKPGMIATLQE
ncbi:L,D-transpeptidase family protein [Rhodanobacter ginsengisoli]|uniref:L,D-transpeptidase family protein n=1 Tax=Rhodanobacter ginsengisoli TaxID=418646 RepID=A0ABW0QN05_9GAMM